MPFFEFIVVKFKLEFSEFVVEFFFFSELKFIVVELSVVFKFVQLQFKLEQFDCFEFIVVESEFFIKLQLPVIVIQLEQLFEFVTIIKLFKLQLPVLELFFM